MKGRGLVVVLALILATVATAGVFLYARGLEEDAQAGGTMVPVVVSKVDIPARTDLDQLIKNDQFRLLEVPQDAVVDGAITSLDQMSGKSNSVAILAGEQIPVARISGEVPGGALAIPEGMEALTVSLDASRAVAGAIQAGDKVSIYSTFKGVSLDPLGESATQTVQADSVTVKLVPTVDVLAVFRPVSSTVFNGEETTQSEQLPGSVAITLALSPEDAQRFVFAMENGTTWLGLLPPDENGQSQDPITYAEVLT
ncbi:MAG TPA: Flp pilus assembly protein CpaB [Actinomycetota bacterium]|jgi:pilus assembly protein CpaB|nr:Flp pilus assembly protein CpaB [Actinomycetota bacterium]